MTTTTIYNESFKRLYDEDLEKINGGYILDRGYGCCRFALIDDFTGDCYCYANTLSGILDKELSETYSRQIISLEDYRNIFGRDFL